MTRGACPARLAAPERIKVDAHLEALHTLEAGLKRAVLSDCPAPPLLARSLGQEDYLRTVMDFSLQLFIAGSRIA